jgi:crotonobetainyl-CoA:carnitine CoA-transferase CaiB-like acyl-CoA transferase
MVATPIDFAGTPWEPRSTAPGIGEHTREVLTKMGRSDEEIETLLASGAATEDGSD